MKLMWHSTPLESLTLRIKGLMPEFKCQGIEAWKSALKKSEGESLLSVDFVELKKMMEVMREAHLS